MRATVLGLIDRSSALMADEIAVRGPDGTVSYAELTARANDLARALGELGVGRGDLVGLCLPRSANLVVGALGIVKAGAAYVAIDPAYPDERVRWMLDDSAAAAVVTDTAGATCLGDRGRRPFPIPTA